MNSIKDIFKSTKAKQYTAMAFAIIGICIIGTTYITNNSMNIIQTQEQDYGNRLESRIKEILESIAGLDTTEVMITFENSYVLQEAQQKSTAAFSHSTNTKNVSYTEIPNPKISGVMITCSSLNNADDFKTIKQAVSTCLDIPQNKIYIIGGKPDNENH